MRTLLLTVEYDGSGYVGWQRQPAHHGMSVQQRLEEALQQVFGEEIRLHGAGRTDAGVHAFGQCCHFKAAAPVPVEKLPAILNAKLPPGLCVRSAQQVADDFHARFDAQGKHYRYVIERSAARSAFTGRYSWQLDAALDVDAMRCAAAYLLGEHDFRHFTVSGVSASHFVRRIDTLTISEPQPEDNCLPWQKLTAPLVIDIEGNGFLYKMVRIITARLVAVGKGQIAPQAMVGYLDGSFTEVIPPAPPGGLMLMEVYYDAKA